MTKFYMSDNVLEFHGSLKTDSLRQALLWSIEKFETIAAHLAGGGDPVHNYGPDTCALCVYAENKSDRYSCDECPIYQAYSGNGGCRKTPYEIFTHTQTEQNARREAEFLRGFLDEVKR